MVEPPGDANDANDADVARLSGIALSESDAERKKRRKHYRLNAVEIPRIRALGLALVTGLVIINNAFILNDLSWPPIVLLAVVNAVYAFVTWLVLLAVFRRKADSNITVVFLTTDIFIWTFAVYLSGAAQSWLFFVLMIRAIDQSGGSLRKVLYYGHVSVLSYVLMLVYVQVVDHSQVDWLAGGAKTLILYIANISISRSRPEPASSFATSLPQRSVAP